MKKRLILGALFFLSLCFYSNVSFAYVKDGVHKQYYKNGQVKFEAIYKDGTPDGIAITYDEEGHMLKKVLFENGELKKVVWESPEANFGPFAFLFSWQFWLASIAIIGIAGFIFVKILSKKTAF